MGTRRQTFDFEGEPGPRLAGADTSTDTSITGTGGFTSGPAYPGDIGGVMPNWQDQIILARQYTDGGHTEVQYRLTELGVTAYDMGLLEAGAGEEWPNADYPLSGGPAGGMFFGISHAREGTVPLVLRGEGNVTLGHYRFTDGFLVWEPGRHTYSRRRGDQVLGVDGLTMEDRRLTDFTSPPTPPPPRVLAPDEPATTIDGLDMDAIRKSIRPPV